MELPLNAPDRLLTASEVAERLQVPESWVREQAREGHVPNLRLGRYVRFSWPAVEAWLEECRKGGTPTSWRKHAPQHQAA